MLQWIAGLEKIAATSPFAASNRFGSFAPIRLNVSAQWLVDGVCFAFGGECLFELILVRGTISGTCHVQCYLQKIQSTFMIGGCLPVSVSQFSLVSS